MNIPCLRALVAFSLTPLLIGVLRSQSIIHVNVAAVGNNDGSSWADAFTELQAALAVAQEMDQVWIAQGIYKPTAGTDRSISFALDTNVAWYGGFGGWETSVDERDWVAHPTILSGNIGDPLDSLDNSYHVAYGYLDHGNNIIDGLILEDGHADGTIAFGNGGGGLSMEDSNLMLRNCVVRRCYAAGTGGGVHVTNSGFSMINTRLELNVSRGHGGGAYAWNIYGTLQGCAFIGNKAVGNESGNGGSGGGLLEHGSFEPLDCLFEGNYANQSGGALNSSDGRAAQCRFVGNISRQHGGAIHVDGSTIRYAVYECDFIDNRVLDPLYSGGAVYLKGTSSSARTQVFASRFIGNHSAGHGGALYQFEMLANVHSCVFNGNSAEGNGGALAFYSGAGDCRILNSTFVGNDALGQGKAIYDWSIWYDSTLVVNSIFRDNAQPEIERHPNGHDLDLRRSVVQGTFPGTDLFDLDPLFVDALGSDGIPGTEDDDLRLSPASPCIALGTPDTTGLNLFHVDADGDMRIAGIVDLGACEVSDCGLAVSIAQVPPDTVICSSLLTLQVDTPLVGIGRWRVVGSGAGYLSPNTPIQHGNYSPLMRFAVPFGDSYFEWSVEHCGVVTRDTVRITRVPIPAAAVVLNNGPATLCPGDSTTLSVDASGAMVEWSNGDSTDTITVGPGTYTARLTNGAGCVGPWSNELVVNTVNVPPAPVVNVNGSLSLCANMGQSVILSSGGTQLQYLWSTGATTNSITVDTTGTVTLTVTNTSGCSSSPSDPVNVVLHPQPPAPLLTLAGDTSICSGSSVTIGTAEPATNYFWSNGATSSSITTSTAGAYSLYISDALGCHSLRSDTVHVSIDPVVVPNIVADGPPAFCPGDSVTLSTTPSYVTYIWSNGSTDTSITVFSAGSITVAVVDSNGCASTSAATPVAVYPLPAVPVISSTFVSNGVVNLTTSSSAGATYAWYRDGVLLPSATTNQLNGVTIGASYVVIITNAQGCSSTSQPFSAPVGIADQGQQITFTVFPNPGRGLFLVQSDLPAGTVLDLLVNDRIGQVVLQQPITAEGPQQPMRIDLSALADGPYQIRLSSEAAVGVATVIVLQ